MALGLYNEYQYYYHSAGFIVIVIILGLITQEITFWYQIDLG